MKKRITIRLRAAQISKTHLKRVLNLVIQAITQVLDAKFVEDVGAIIPAEDDDFPKARYIMDATFQPIWTPLGTYNERKRFYSGKHKRYGLKTQCSALRTTLAIGAERSSSFWFPIARFHGAGSPSGNRVRQWSKSWSLWVHGQKHQML